MGIDGTWYNELGSWLVLQLGPDGRSLTGVYHSAVGHAVEEYILSGRVDDTPGGWPEPRMGGVVAERAAQ